jgi:hypothetical protein
MVGFFDDGIEEQTKLRGFLEWFYPGRQTNEYNLEEVMAYLDLSRARARLWGIGSHDKNPFDAAELYESLLTYIRRRLTTEQDACSVHKRLFEQLSQQDSIITLNYDLVADRALKQIESGDSHESLRRNSRMEKMLRLIGQATYVGGTAPFLGKSALEWGFYLKLHGSLDWIYCSNPDCANNVHLYPLKDERTVETVEGAPCKLCGTALQIYLVPPVAAKRLQDRGRLAFLWNLALREIAGAHDLALIGISFAPSDFELRWLMKQALAVQTSRELHIHLVNPKPEDRVTAKKTIPNVDAVWHEYETIAAYLSGEEVHLAEQANVSG